MNRQKEKSSPTDHTSASNFVLRRVRGAIEPAIADFPQKLESSDEFQRGRLGDVVKPAGAPPNIVLLQQQDGFRSIISPPTIQFVLELPEYVQGTQDAYQYTQQRINKFLRQIRPLIGSKIKWVGVISEFFLRADTPKEAAPAICDWLADIGSSYSVENDAISFTLQHGVRRDHHNILLKFDGYSTRAAFFPANETPRTIKTSELPLLESGVQVTVDVNDKPMRKEAAASTKLKNLIQYITPRVESWVQEEIKLIRGNK
ncbi:MAG: hypothetical protein ACTSX7_11990 [Alphaproteobacteria bacterium]